MQIDQIRREAIEAVLAACKITMAVQKELVPAKITMQKADRSPVSIADLAAQAIISLKLGNEIKLVAEESSEILQTNVELKHKVVEYVQTVDQKLTENEIMQAIDRGNHQGGNGLFWVLDPIDGTKGFLRHQQYAICLALIDQGEIILSVLGCPNLKISDDETGGLFIAQKDCGAYMRSLNNKVETKIKVSEVADSRQATFVESVESGHANHGLQQDVAKNLGITRKSVRLDSQVKFAAIAKGDADIYLRFSPTKGYQQKIWDIAPGVLLVEEAGGKTSDTNGDPLDFTRGRMIPTASLFVTNGKLHEVVLDAINKTR